MSPDSEEPTVNLPNSDDGNGGKKVPETPALEEEVDDTIVMGGGGAPDDSDQLTVVAEAEGDETIGAADDTDAPPARAVADPAPGSAAGTSHVFANRFEVVALLGEGGMGRVYQVRDRQIEGREVALKVLRPRYSRNARFRDLFFQEIRAAQKFVSEQVNQVRDTGQMDDGRLFLTMDLVNGEDLRQLMKREKSLNTRHALEVTRQMLLALQSGHEQGFVHRDVKPPNVMLASQVSKTDENPYGIGVRLLDFGIAALAAEVGEGTVAGTPMYMSPEQATGQRLDARSDLFSVGIVLYEMLSGARPFEGATLQEISTSLVETQVAPMIKSLDHLKPAVQKILRKALEKDREKRYQSAGEFIDAIENSKAYRVPTGVPGWVGGLLVLSMVAAAGEGGMIYMKDQELGDLRAEKSDSGREALDEKVTELRVQKADHERLMQSQEESHAKILAMKDSSIATLQTQIDELNRSEVDVAIDSNELNRLNFEIEELRTAKDSMQAEVLLLQEANTSLNERLSQTQKVQDPSSQAAKALDQFLEYIDRELYVIGAEFISARISDNVYVKEGLSGGDEIQVLASAVGALGEYMEDLENGGDPRRGLLTSAKELTVLASEQQHQFETAGSVWLPFELEGQESDPARLAAWALAIEKVQAKIGLTIQEHNARSEADAQMLTDGKADQDPDPVIAHGEENGWEGFDAFFGKLVALIETAERDGKLDIEALKKLSTLDEWGQYVAAGTSSIDAKYADTIRWFYYAKKWYVDQDATLKGPGLDQVIRNGSTPKSDWRSVLALQVELFDLPVRIAKHSRYYHEVVKQKTAWIEEVVSVVPQADSVSGATGWSIDRVTYNPTRRPTRTLSFEYLNGVLYGPGRVEWVNLFDPSAEIAWWIPPGHIPTGNFLNFPDESEIKEFTANHPAPGLPCLIVEDKNGVERWFSPELGPVYEHTDVPKTRELIFR